MRPRPLSDPSLRFIGFHHAGGSAAGYHGLATRLPSTWDVLLLDLPGRGRRHAEPLARDMAAVVDVATRDVMEWTNVPCVLFGHSMGAIVAVEVAHRLTGIGAPPLWVGLSGRPDPDMVPRRRTLSTLDDDELLATLLNLGGTPQRIDEIPELRSLFLRVVRADLEAVDSYRPARPRQPLPCPVTVFGGLADPWAPPASLDGWAVETRAPLRRCLFGGGHFYFMESGFAELARAIRGEVGAVLADMAVAGPLDSVLAGTVAADRTGHP